MCKYVKENKCSITDKVCPYMYFCTRWNKWKPLNSMPENCKVKVNQEIPKGYYRVREERKGYLYVDIQGQTYKIENPFDEVPQYVKAIKTKSGWKLRK